MSDDPHGFDAATKRLRDADALLVSLRMGAPWHPGTAAAIMDRISESLEWAATEIPRLRARIEAVEQLAHDVDARYLAVAADPAHPEIGLTTVRLLLLSELRATLDRTR